MEQNTEKDPLASPPKPTRRAKKEIIDAVRDILREVVPLPEDTDALSEELQGIEQFDYAAELLLMKIALAKSKEEVVALKDYQDLAKCIYKDQSLPSDFKFEEALNRLDCSDDLTKTQNCETLGLAGAIYKRMWRYDRQDKHMLMSCAYYKRGYEQWKGVISEKIPGDKRNDNGYNAINYAYMLELISANEMEVNGKASRFKDFTFDRLKEAQDKRVCILEQLIRNPFSDDVSAANLINKEPDDWVIEIIAEAYFGLCWYKEACVFIKEYKRLRNKDPWKIKTFAEQLFSLVYLQQTRLDYLKKADIGATPDSLRKEKDINTKDIATCLDLLDIKNLTAVDTDKDGKKGIALSGGGFRAAFFHIGVLAALAERDELRNIEVISCVSGGSIIGAFYYLKLKLLLEEKNDESISREDYVALVKEIEVEFIAGVRNNLRMHIFSNLRCNFKMLGENYSRTNRLGELYEEYLFIPMLKKHFKKKKEDASANYKKGKFETDLEKRNWEEIYMNDLFICPDEKFDFDKDNWKRKNKVPELILNATSLNTGHNFQFTASWMGEPATGIISDIDVKPRLRRMYYIEQAPAPYDKFRLGYAVGASSCVPVMFEPLPLQGLYPEYELQLIDGGLHDNQGIGALIEEECKNVIISDGSGQLPANKKGVVGSVPLFLRADNILQERLRELQFLDMKARQYTTLINRLTTVHLKNGITDPPVKWTGCKDPDRKISYADPTIDCKQKQAYDVRRKTWQLKPDIEDEAQLLYGVRKETQKLIAEIRTDLDAFHETEAFALMYDGYAQIAYELDVVQGNSTNGITKPEGGWRFNDIKNYLTDSELAAEKKELLEVASRVPFKAFFLMPKAMRNVLKVSMIALAIFILYELWTGFHDMEILVWKIITTIVLFIVGFFSKPIGILLDPTGYARKKIAGVGIAIVGWMIFNLYLCCINRSYLRRGKVK